MGMNIILHVNFQTKGSIIQSDLRSSRATLSSEYIEHSDERERRTYVLRRIKSNVFSLPLAFRAAMEGGKERRGAAGQEKEKPRESC